MKATTQKLTTTLKLRIRKLFTKIHGLTFTATIKQIKKEYPKFDARYKTHWYTLLEYLLVKFDEMQEPEETDSQKLVKLFRSFYSDVNINYYPDDTFLGFHHRIFKKFVNRYGEYDSRCIGSVGFNDIQKQWEYRNRNITKVFKNMFDMVAYISKSRAYINIVSYDVA